jgi:hypothetical protein
MGYLIDFAVDAGSNFSVKATRQLDLKRVELAAVDQNSVVIESGPGLLDFSHLSGLAYRGGFVVSREALSLVERQPGVGRLVEFEDPNGCTRYVVQVLLQLDLLDRARSVESGFGPLSYSGIHLLDQADEIAGTSLFVLPPPNHIRLLCSEKWKAAYEALGLTGLEFEPAKVG